MSYSKSKSKSKSKINVSRRDFLSKTASGMAIATMPWMPHAAVAKTQDEIAPKGAEIAKVRIYPAMGISRVGGSPEWFYAPELPGLAPEPEDGNFKGKDGKLKKQVQRFRVYAFDEQNRVIGELTHGGGVDIEWKAQLANTKSAWYGFNNPLDNGAAAPGLPSQKRNQYIVTDEQREEMLVINGGELTVSGRSKNSDGSNKALTFKDNFWEMEEVKLGQLRTDEKGRLLVVPPDGISKSPTNRGITSFADNDGWYDDWCDGPVMAQVKIKGKTYQAESSWVSCVGPNFAPEIPPITSMYDVVSDLNTSKGWSSAPSKPLSYTKYIYPIFRRTALMQWVTNAANQRVGWLGADIDFADPSFMNKLRDASPENKAFRQRVLSVYRDPKKRGKDAYKDQQKKIPYMLGDGINYDGSHLQWFQFPEQQYSFLEDWANGQFINDLPDSETTPITSIEQVDLAQQPHVLTEAALEPLSGGAFHPGVELTYYLRLSHMYARQFDESAEPFRIAHKDRMKDGQQQFVQNIGLLLTPDKAMNGNGSVPAPIGHQMAGDLTRWMGLPWQCDAFSCQQVLLQENFPTAVWWPALLPIDVLAEEDYQQLMNTKLTTQQRRMFFDTRQAWSRGVAGIGYHANASYWDGITNMITLWERMGFVVKKQAPTDPKAPPGLPKDIFVEVGRDKTMEDRFNWKPDNGMLPN